MGLGSGIRKKPIPDPGDKKAPYPGSESARLMNTYPCTYSHREGGLGR